MTTEELLKPRWKVIGDYPHSGYEVGEIIHIDSLLIPRTGEQHLNKYPHLFKRIEWWEERKPEDMPEYVKVLNKIAPFEQFKDEWKNYLAQTKSEFQPATKQEYETYKSSQP